MLFIGQVKGLKQKRDQKGKNIEIRPEAERAYLEGSKEIMIAILPPSLVLDENN